MLIFWKYFDKGNSVLIYFFKKLSLMSVLENTKLCHVVPGANLFIAIFFKKGFCFGFFLPQ